MKNSISYIYSALIAVAVLIAPLTQAAEKNTSHKMDPKMEKMMQRCEALGRPSKGHKMLQPLVGNWSVVAKCWMDPKAAPMVSKGSAKTRWIMNGRFLQEEFSGKMMDKSFNGIAITGYDNMKQKYTSIWFDDMSTAIFTSKGTASDNGQVINFTGKMDCPMTGERNVPVKHIVRMFGSKKHVFEMHDPRKGKNSKMMEIVYTRK